MDTTMNTITDNSLAKLQTWLSPSFPVGAFAFSHGLDHRDQTFTAHNRCQRPLSRGLAHQFGRGLGAGKNLNAAHAGQPSQASGCTFIPDRNSLDPKTPDLFCQQIYITVTGQARHTIPAIEIAQYLKGILTHRAGRA